MGRRGRKRTRIAQQVVTPGGARNSLPTNQQMARVNLSSDEWRAFRSAAVLRQRSVSDYLGHLVRKELRRVTRTDTASQPHTLEVAKGSASENPVLVTSARDTPEGW